MKLISLLSILFFPLLTESSGDAPCTIFVLGDPNKEFVLGTILGPETDGSYAVCVQGTWVNKQNEENCNFDLFESIEQPTKKVNFVGDAITISCPSNYFFEHDPTNQSLEIELTCKSDGWHHVTGDKLVESPIKCVFCKLQLLYESVSGFQLVVNLPTSDDKFSFPLECKKNFELPNPETDLKATCSSGTWEINWENDPQNCERRTTCDSNELLESDVSNPAQKVNRDVKMTFDLNGKKFYLE